LTRFSVGAWGSGRRFLPREAPHRHGVRGKIFALSSRADSSTITGIAAPRAGEAPRGPALYVVLDARRPLAAPSRHRLDGLERVQLGRGDARAAVRAGSSLAITLDDARVSRAHARLTRDGDSWFVEDQESKNGTLLGEARLGGRRLLRDGDVLTVGNTLLLFRERAATAEDAVDLVVDGAAAPGLATLIPALADGFADLVRLAPTDAPVCVLGETGTGKELVARACHALSGRSGPFVAVNCAALPGALVEGELFGWKKGAFTGADEERAGLVRTAGGGTLFLDEIGELPPGPQAAILRVLQEREVLPLGARRAEKVDVRVVSASNRDLPRLVETGHFRADLWARLAGFALRLPPLAERREDLGLIVAALLRRLVPDRGARLSLTVESARALLAAPWPLNVRGLENAVRVALARAAGDVLDVRVDDTPGPRAGTPLPAPRPAADGAEASRWDRRRAELVALLDKHAGNVAAVARELGRDRTTVYEWMKRLGVDGERFRR
jgi:DNA-binding NtrC family response regulator